MGMLPVDSSSRAGHYSSILQEEETEIIARDAAPGQDLVDPQDLIEPTSTQSDRARPRTAIDPVVDHKQPDAAAKLRGMNVMMNTDPATAEDALTNTDRATKPRGLDVLIGTDGTAEKVPRTTDRDPKPRGLDVLMHSVDETVAGKPQEAHREQLISETGSSRNER